MEAVIYIRWSSAEQAKGSSEERQREACRRLAEAKGWKVADELVDDGVSAFKGKHAQSGKLGRFVDDVEAGAYPGGVILLTEKLDRLSREEAKKVFLWMMRVTELGVVVCTVEGDRRYDATNLDMATIIEVVVKSALANEESAKKSTRLAAAWASKRAKLGRDSGAVMTRRAPAWLDVEGTPARFVVLEERAAIVRRIFEETVAGFGKHHIARKLNMEGVATFGRASGWHASYVQKILNSKAVLGEFQPGRKARGDTRKPAGDPIQGYYPAIVDAGLHAEAMRSMSGRRRTVTGRGRRLANMFSGLARCADCGTKMTFRAKGLKRRASGEWMNEDYLVCDSYQRGRGCENGFHFNYGLWEGGCLDATLLDAMGDRHFAAPVEVRSLEVDLAERVRSRDAAKGRASTALSAFVETERQEAKDMWLRLSAEADHHQADIDQLRRRIIDARGVVEPKEHLRRIMTLRNSMQADDEDVRFESRAKIMDAFGELVTSMNFSKEPLGVEMTTKDERKITVHFDEVAGGTDWSSWDEAA